MNSLNKLSMKKTMILWMTVCLSIITGYAQKVQESQFIGEVVALTSDSTIINLEKKIPTIKSKSGISVRLTGFGAVKTHMHVEGNKAASRIKCTDNTIELLIRVADNNNDPTDCIRLFKFEQKKKERRAEMASVNTFGQASADNLNYIPFEGRKYGESSYLIRFKVTEPCELGVIVSNTGIEKDGQLIIRCLGVD